MSADAITELAPDAVPDAPPAVAALAVHGVSHAYGTREALRDVSLTVPQSRFTALLGLNGAGKTTLFSLITRLSTIHVTDRSRCSVIVCRVSQARRCACSVWCFRRARSIWTSRSWTTCAITRRCMALAAAEARERSLAALHEIGFGRPRQGSRAEIVGRADAAERSRSHGHCCTGPVSWCWTNRRSGWTSPPVPPSCVMCARSFASAVSPCCGQPIFSTKSWLLMRLSCCTAAMFSRQAMCRMSWRRRAPWTCGAPLSR